MSTMTINEARAIAVSMGFTEDQAAAIPGDTPEQVLQNAKFSAPFLGKAPQDETADELVLDDQGRIINVPDDWL